MMKQVTLGHSDLRVSQMGFGHCDFGTKVTKQAAFKVLDDFFEKGGNFIDTSNNYAVWNPNGVGGECEKIIGEWIHSRGIREKIVLATKVGAGISDKAALSKSDGSLVDDWYLRGEGLSANAINQAIDCSLKRLKTDYIDLYYAHVEDPQIPVAETIEAFNNLHKQGKIRAIGCSNHSAWRVKEALDVSKQNGFISYCCIQDLHSYLQPLPSKRSVYATPEKIDFVKQHPEVSLIAYTPTLWGKLAQPQNYKKPGFWNEFDTPDTQHRLEVLTNMAEKYNISEVQVVYAWLMQSEPNAVPLVTTSSQKHLAENLLAANLKLSNEDIQILNTAGHK